MKLTIREEEENGYLLATDKVGVVTGRHSIFQLSPELTKIFAGGYPSDFHIQPDVIYNDFEGQMEELMIGGEQVSLWNFVDAENNNQGARERYDILLYGNMNEKGWGMKKERKLWWDGSTR